MQILDTPSIIGVNKKIMPITQWAPDPCPGQGSGRNLQNSRNLHYNTHYARGVCNNTGVSKNLHKQRN